MVVVEITAAAAAAAEVAGKTVDRENRTTESLDLAGVPGWTGSRLIDP